MNILNSILRKFKSKETNLDPYESDLGNHNPISNITVINDFLQFDTAKDAWTSLLDKLINKSKFLSHDWFNTSWIWNEPIGSPNIILVYKEQELVAIFPLLIESIKNKNVFKLISNPLSSYNDAIINPEHAEYAVTTLFEVLSAWSKYWDRLELTNLPIHSTLLKKIWHQKRKNLPFKYKIKTMDSVSYVKLYQEDKITDWDAWVDNQSTSTKKMLLKSAPLNQATNSKADVNTLETQKTNIDNLNQLSKSLSEVVDNQHTASLNKLNRSRITLSFIKRFTYYNKHNNWVVHFDCLKNQIKLSTQYAILDNNNCYYLTTSNVSRTTSKNVSKLEERILQSSVLKSCFEDKISRFYLNNSLPAFFKNWKTENENRFQIIIYNKSKKWF